MTLEITTAIRTCYENSFWLESIKKELVAATKEALIEKEMKPYNTQELMAIRAIELTKYNCLIYLIRIMEEIIKFEEESVRIFNVFMPIYSVIRAYERKTLSAWYPIIFIIINLNTLPDAVYVNIDKGLEAETGFFKRKMF